MNQYDVSFAGVKVTVNWQGEEARTILEFLFLGIPEDSGKQAG